MDFCDPTLAELLILHQMNDFEILWDLPAQSVEEPNYRRGGWSGVWYFSLSDGNGTVHNYFLKRQQNHTARRGLLFSKRPTFYFEYRNMLFCHEHNLPSADVAFYGERKKSPPTDKQKNAPGYRAILITRAIEDYTPFSKIFSGWAVLTEKQRLDYLLQIANLVADLHKNRFSHNGLYPKHLFVNLAKTPPVKMIDMEGMRFQWWPARQSISELEKFVRRTNGLSNSETEYFLKEYWQRNNLGLSFHGLVKRFQKRLKRKSK